MTITHNGWSPSYVGLTGNNVGPMLSAGCDLPSNADYDSHTASLCSQCQLASKTPDGPSKQEDRSRGPKSGMFPTQLEANSTAASAGYARPRGQTPEYSRNLLVLPNTFTICFVQQKSKSECVQHGQKCITQETRTLHHFGKAVSFPCMYPTFHVTCAFCHHQ